MTTMQMFSLLIQHVELLRQVRVSRQKPAIQSGCDFLMGNIPHRTPRFFPRFQRDFLNFRNCGLKTANDWLRLKKHYTKTSIINQLKRN